MQQSEGVPVPVEQASRKRLAVDLEELIESREATPGRAVETAVSASEVLLGVIMRSLVDTLQLLSFSQYSALSALALGSSSASELSVALGMTPQSVTTVLTSLDRGGWVQEIGDVPSDYELTAHGQQIVNHVNALRRAELDRLLASIPETELPLMTRALGVLSEAASTSRPGRLFLGLEPG